MRNASGLERTARPSLLDRLIDLRPQERSDELVGQDASVARFRASVLRDVEWLLNTRRTIAHIPEGLSEVTSSVFAYGLADVTSMSLDSPEVRAGLVRQIERTIELFEPRLTDVRVSLVDAPDERRQIRFSIEGVLQMEPAPERVVFDTVMEVARGDFSVGSGS
ncbi:MAG TPA: type VI secretion system baseplate subunit TssE [Longimicrobiales bacterium]|nr:type VI secretion system baseplate subunit TssE [Longimicrobiales bacterium]